MAEVGSVLPDAWGAPWVVVWADMEDMDRMEEDMVAAEEWEEDVDGNFEDKRWEFQPSWFVGI